MNSARSSAAERKPRVLYVAYPLLPVSEHSAGGAEQVLWALEREMHSRGLQTTVAASRGSQVSGDLFSTGDPADTLDQFEARCEQQNRALREWLRASSPQFDLIHDMSGGFWQHTEDLQLPVLATLHLARRLYHQVNFSVVPSCVSFNCVSRSQTSEFEDLPRVLGGVPNGIAVDRFPREFVPGHQREYLLWVGRICEEKGTHTALDVAHKVGARMIIAGTVYPFLYHQKYFAREIIPRLKRAGNLAKYVEGPSFSEKVDLLRNARALLITSDINETSSLVAMEAAACGTPVIALSRGALSEVVAKGITGLLVENADEMIAALGRVSEIDGHQCREYAERHYLSAQMANGYAVLYQQIRMQTMQVWSSPL